VDGVLDGSLAIPALAVSVTLCLAVASAPPPFKAPDIVAFYFASTVFISRGWPVAPPPPPDLQYRQSARPFLCSAAVEYGFRRWRRARWR